MCGAEYVSTGYVYIFMEFIFRNFVCDHSMYFERCDPPNRNPKAVTTVKLLDFSVRIVRSRQWFHDFEVMTA